MPERGVELDFDASQDAIEDIINVELEALLNDYKSSLKYGTYPGLLTIVI